MDGYLREAQRRFVDGTLDGEEAYKDELARAVGEARVALLADAEDWEELLTAAIGHPKNNLINARSYAEGQDSNQAKIARWIEDRPDDVRGALEQLWHEGERSPAERVRAFDERLPDDVFGRRARSARMDVASYLMMGNYMGDYKTGFHAPFWCIGRLKARPHPTYVRSGDPLGPSSQCTSESCHLRRACRSLNQ